MNSELKKQIRAVLDETQSADPEVYTRSHAMIRRKAVEWLEQLLEDDVRPVDPSAPVSPRIIGAARDTSSASEARVYGLPHYPEGS